MSDERDHHRLPPDPAGTQPKVEASKLLPERVERPREDVPVPVEPADEPALFEPPHEAPHAAKFQFILGALLAIGIVGLAALGILVADRASEAGKAAWSAWKPSDAGIEGAQQIADHVAPRYKGSNGKQLTAVTAHEFEVELESTEVPMRVAMRERKEDGGEVKLLDGDTVLYRLCGLGERCGLGGNPSESRALLLRRQALEMALYSFRYLDGIDQVVMFMPPAFARAEDEKTKKTYSIRLDNQALWFDRDELAPLLDLPLERTLPGKPPTVRKAKQSPDAMLVANVTETRKFTYSMVPGNGEDRVWLVLENLDNRQAVLRQREQALEAEKQAADALPGEPVEPSATD